MLLLDVLRKIGKNPRINQRLQRCQSCLRVNHQYLLKKCTQSSILNESTQRLARRNDGLSIFSLNDLRRKVLIEVFLGVFAILKVLLRGSATQTHDQTDLLLLVFPSEERVPKVQLSYQTSEAPRIDGEVIPGTEDDLRRAVETRLNVEKIGLINEHTCPEVDYLDAHLRLVLHQHVFRLQVAVDHSQLPEKRQRGKQLYRKSSNVIQIKRPKVVCLQQLVKIGRQYFSDDTDMLPENDEVLNPQQIFAILYVLLLDLHQDVNLVQSQLHVLPPRPDDLHRHHLPRLVVERLDDLTKRAPSQTLQKFISISDLLVPLPQIAALEVVLAHPASHAHIIYRLFVDELNALVFRQHRLEPLQNFLSGEAGKRPSEMFVIQQL